uniref:Uncharacterized protein n=1 Tax=Heterorhabditis bacteriophora TaxID=37862 RepID=A0A1I7XII5_HETBA
MDTEFFSETVRNRLRDHGDRMHWLFYLILCSLCQVAFMARPIHDRNEIQKLIDAEYSIVYNTLRLRDQIENEIERRLEDYGSSRIRRKVGEKAVGIPIKRLSRIGGNIVMGRRK